MRIRVTIVCVVLCQTVFWQSAAYASGLYPTNLKDCSEIVAMRGIFGWTGTPSPYSDAPNLEAKWNPSVAGKIGIRNLFDGTCLSCHAKPAAGVSPTAAYLKYNACANCHRSSSDVVPGMSAFGAGTGTYPENLDFFPSGTEVPPALMARSYYSPGLNKAAASLIRSYDGTMPPQHTDYAYDANFFATNSKGWCYQIFNTYRAWIDAGYPL